MSLYSININTQIIMTMKDKILYEKTEYRGYNINIYYDTEAENPRTWSNLGTVYTAHRKYKPEEDFDANFNIEDVFSDKLGNFKDSFLQNYIAMPIYLYDHSGVTISTTPFSCRWDSGFFGIIAVETAKVKKEYDWGNLTKSRREKIETYLKAEVEVLDNYFTGAVYSFTITAANDEEIDSCHGFYGDDGLTTIKQECQSFIDCHIKDQCIEQYKEFTETIKGLGMQLIAPAPNFSVITE